MTRLRRKDKPTAEPAAIQEPATLRKFELPPDFKFDIGVQYVWDDDNALMDQVHDVVADLRVQAQAKALAKAKSLTTQRMPRRPAYHRYTDLVCSWCYSTYSS